MRLFHLISFLFILLAPIWNLAADPLFSVEIVGAEQGDWTETGNAPPIPMLDVPLEQVNDHSRLWDIPEPKHFYVLVRNISKQPVNLNLDFSDWCDCLEFEITSAAGKMFHVCRPCLSWSRNFRVPWYFAPDGVKIFTIYFTSDIWDGLPSIKEIPDNTKITIQAKFSYPVFGPREKDFSRETYASARIAAVATR